MSFTVRLAADLIAVEAGSTTPLVLEVANRSAEAEQFEVVIEGLDPEWTAAPVASFGVDPHDTHAEKVFFKPPRSSESRAGNYPFVIRVRSLVSGETRAAQGMLEVRPYHHLSLEMEPRRGAVGPMSPVASFTVTVLNLGNSEHSVQFFASELDDQLAFAFEPERVNVGPGQQVSATLRATAVRRSLLSNARLYGVSVTARSTTVPTVTSTVQAQVEQRGLVTPVAAIVVLLAAVLVAGWIWMLPKPPRVVAFDLTPRQIVVGEPATATWSVANAGGVRLTLNGETMLRSEETQGTYRFEPKAPGAYRVGIVATTNVAASPPQVLDLIVTPRQVAPPPVIEAFDITPRQGRAGQPLVVRYRVSESAVRAVLSPPGEQLDLSINEIELIPRRTGRIAYRLVVENADGVTAERTVTVEIVEGSDASIVAFSAHPAEVIDVDGRVTLAWQLAGAVRVELLAGEERVLVEPQGSREFVITRETVFRIVGYDARGRTVERRLTVPVRPAAPAPAAEPAPPAPAEPAVNDPGTRK
jgi:hypothetical protein